VTSVGSLQQDFLVTSLPVCFPFVKRKWHLVQAGLPSRVTLVHKRRGIRGGLKEELNALDVVVKRGQHQWSRTWQISASKKRFEWMTM
jgi:hypothetical protein